MIFISGGGGGSSGLFEQREGKNNKERTGEEGDFTLSYVPLHAADKYTWTRGDHGEVKLGISCSSLLPKPVGDL